MASIDEYLDIKQELDKNRNDFILLEEFEILKDTYYFPETVNNMDQKEYILLLKKHENELLPKEEYEELIQKFILPSELDYPQKSDISFEDFILAVNFVRNNSNNVLIKKTELNGIKKNIQFNDLSLKSYKEITEKVQIYRKKKKTQMLAFILICLTLITINPLFNFCSYKTREIISFYYTLKGNETLAQQNYKETLLFYKKANDLIKNRIDLGAFCTKIGNKYKADGNFEEAIIWYKTARDNGSNIDVGKYCTEVGTNYHSKKDYENAKNWFIKAKYYGDKIDVVKYCKEISEIYEKQGDYDNAERWNTISKNLDLGKLFKENGDSCKEVGKYATAEDWYKKANYYGANIDIAKYCIEIGDLYHKQKKYIVAEKWYKAANENGAKIDIKNYYKEIADIYDKQGKYSVALIYYQKSYPTGTKMDTEKYLKEKIMVLVSPGTNAAGTITRPFYISKFEVTQEEYYSLIKLPTPIQGDNLPINYVSWNQAITYCNARSKAEGLKPFYSIDLKAVIEIPDSNGYRLPTKKEWQFAAMGGVKSLQYKYSGSNTMEDIAWYINNSENILQPVGGKSANELGIYDMNGNVWEWCWDFSKNGVYHILCGGSVNSYEYLCDFSSRLEFPPSKAVFDSGFRICRNQ